MIRRRGRIWVPVVVSFAVYLVPLVGPHAIWLLGESLAQQLRDPGSVDPGWLAANLALACATQITVALLLAWSTRRSHLRLLIWVPVVPALVAGLNIAYLVAIPSYFLIEPDTAVERSGWEEHCFIPDAALMAVRTPVTQSATGVQNWWMQRPDVRYALLHLPDCAMAEAALPVPAARPQGGVEFSLGFQFAAPGGAAILERVISATSARSWWLLSAPLASLVPVEASDLVEGAPILSDEADAVGWAERVGTETPLRTRVVIHALQPSASLDRIEIDLEPFGRGSYTLLGVDTVAREVILWRDREPLLVGFDGAGRNLRFTPGQIRRSQPSTYLRVRDGWVAWDAYREDGPYQLGWSLPTGSGTHRTNKGRSVTAAAVDSSGSFIAISETTTLSIGDARDVVYVIRTGDGADVFRKYLPRYTRSHVVFFQGGLFAYSDLAGTHVLKVR